MECRFIGLSRLSVFSLIFSTRADFPISMCSCNCYILFAQNEEYGVWIQIYAIIKRRSLTVDIVIFVVGCVVSRQICSLHVFEFESNAGQ